MTAGASFVPRASSIKVTVAPGITLPWASFTVPVTFPVVICAEAGTAAPTSRQTVSISIHAARAIFLNFSSQSVKVPARPEDGRV